MTAARSTAMKQVDLDLNLNLNLNLNLSTKKTRNG